MAVTDEVVTASVTSIKSRVDVDHEGLDTTISKSIRDAEVYLIKDSFDREDENLNLAREYYAMYLLGLNNVPEFKSLESNSIGDVSQSYKNVDDHNNVYLRLYEGLKPRTSSIIAT